MTNPLIFDARLLADLALDVVVGDVPPVAAGHLRVALAVAGVDRLGQLQALERVRDLVDGLLGGVEHDARVLHEDPQLELGGDAVVVDGVHHLVGRERVHCYWPLLEPWIEILDLPIKEKPWLCTTRVVLLCQLLEADNWAKVRPNLLMARHTCPIPNGTFALVANLGIIAELDNDLMDVLGAENR